MALPPRFQLGETDNCGQGDLPARPSRRENRSVAWPPRDPSFEDDGDIFLPLQQLGFDPDSLRFADTSIYVTPSGRFKFEKIGEDTTSATSESPVARTPRVTAPRPPPPSSNPQRRRAKPADDNSAYGSLEETRYTSLHLTTAFPGTERFSLGSLKEVLDDERDSGQSDVQSSQSNSSSAVVFPSHSLDAFTVESPRRSPNNSLGAFQSTAPEVHASTASQYRRDGVPIGPLPGHPNRVAASTPFISTGGLVNNIDTLTPVFISPSSLITSSDDPRENGYPGEALLLEKSLMITTSFGVPFQNGIVRVFRNVLAGNLRFYSRIVDGGRSEGETFIVRNADAELVPMYAYDISKRHVIYIRDGQQGNQLPQSPSSVNMAYGGFSAIYQFGSAQDMFDFQGRLLSEDVVLDISSLRYVEVAQSGFHTRQIDAPRLQLWHQRRSQLGDPGDQISFMSAGTALSGPVKEKTKPRCSRLFLFLGRSEEYLMVFVTDDITLKVVSPTRVHLTATKYSGKDYLKSRAGVKCLHVSRTNNAAGLKLSKSGMDPDDEESFSQYKTFHMEFENEQSSSNFRETWEQILQARRKERLVLKQAREKMAERVFSGPAALKII